MAASSYLTLGKEMASFMQIGMSPQDFKLRQIRPTEKCCITSLSCWTHIFKTQKIYRWEINRGTTEEEEGQEAEMRGWSGVDTEAECAWEAETTWAGGKRAWHRAAVQLAACGARR